MPRPPRAALLPLLLLVAAASAHAQIGISVGNTDAPRGRVTIEDGRARIWFGFTGRGAEPLWLEAPASAVRKTDAGYTVKGDVTVDTHAGPLPLLGAELVLGAKANGDLTSLRGRCAVPAPFVSDRVRVPSPAMAELGYDLGENIDLGVPLQSSRAYLFFHFDAGLNVEVATNAGGTPPITLSVPGGADGTLILDPDDHFYYLGGAFLADEKGGDEDADPIEGADDRERRGDRGDESKGGADDRADDRADDSANDRGGPVRTGRGRSQQGLIPWTPENTRGIAEHAQGFLGHEVQTGSVPIGQLPLVVEGHLVTRFDAGASDGWDPLGAGLPVAYRAGASGDVLVALPLARMAGVGTLAEFGFGLGRATAAVKVAKDAQHAYFTGYVDPDLSWLPNGTPFAPSGNALVVGFVSTDLATSKVECWGEIGVDLSWFGELSGIRLDGGLSAEGYVRADRDGLTYSAKTSLPIGPFVPAGEVKVVARYGAPAASQLSLSGAFRVSGRTVNGTILFTSRGASIEGDLAGEVDLTLRGRVERTSAGLALVANVVLDDDLRAPLLERVRAEAEAYRSRLDAALADARAAAKDHEFELSLRGVRKALPTICDRAIAEIDGIPGKVKAEWPSKRGIEVPGRKAATKSARTDARPLRDRFVELKKVARGGDDAKLRAKLNEAIDAVIAKKRLKVKVAVVGTVYDRDVITKAHVAQLREAQAAIRALPAVSERKVRTQAVLDAIPRDAVLDGVARGIESGAGDAVPRIEAIQVTLPFAGARGPAEAAAWVVQGGRREQYAVAFDPGRARDLGLAIAEAWARSRTR